jgi:hypothetical protein
MSVSVACNKRNMYICNCSVHSFNKGHAFMHMWDETEGGKGSQEIATDLSNILHNMLLTVSTLFHTLMCVQVRNWHYFLPRLVNWATISADIIVLKFMVSGH